MRLRIFLSHTLRNTLIGVTLSLVLAGTMFVASAQAGAATVPVGNPCTSNAACNRANGESCMWDTVDERMECCSTAWGCTGAATIQTESGLSNSDPRAIVARVINITLGFLGIIAVIIIVAAGFIWMTAAGDEGKIETAKKMMSAGVIGLVIVLAAFGIAQFVVNALVEATATP